jgi:hypothetical protein
MNFWERTWVEHGDVLKRAYGYTSPPETVISFSWPDRPRCPGACALALPPVESSRDPLRHRRDDWLYLTMGLSQPLDRKQVKAEREDGRSYSAYGIELGFVVPNQCDWPADALHGFMTHITDGVDIKWGDRFAFGFTELPDGRLGGFTGNPEQVGVPAVGNIRAVLFWRYLFPDWEFVTSTGKFMVLIATGITDHEWQAAKETTTVHLQLLLCLSGIGQRTIVERRCLFASSRWQEEWDRIKGWAPEECDRVLEAGVGQWHLARPPSGSTLP